MGLRNGCGRDCHSPACHAVGAQHVRRRHGPQALACITGTHPCHGRLDDARAGVRRPRHRVGAGGAAHDGTGGAGVAGSGRLGDGIPVCVRLVLWAACLVWRERPAGTSGLQRVGTARRCARGDTAGADFDRTRKPGFGLVARKQMGMGSGRFTTWRRRLASP